MIDWQPIETAPKDGTKILACVSGFLPLAVKWEGGQWRSMIADAGEYPGRDWDATHWAHINYPEDPDQ